MNENKNSSEVNYENPGLNDFLDDFFIDFLKYRFINKVANETIGDYREAFLSKKAESAQYVFNAVDAVLDKYCEENSNTLGEDKLREIALYRNYLQRKVDQLEKANDQEKPSILSKVENIIRGLSKQYEITGYYNADIGFLRGNTEINFNTNYSVVEKMQSDLELEFGMPLNLLLANQDIETYLEKNRYVDAIESDDNRLRKIMDNKIEKLDDKTKAEKQNEVSNLTGFVLANNSDYNYQKDKINLLVDTFVYLDKDDLVDSVGLEKGMAKVAEFVKIFNDSMANAKNKKPELAEAYKEIDFFSGEMQKAADEKNYSKASIIWNRLKSIFKLVVTLGISKDAREGAKQPLLNLRKNAFKQACKDLRKELEEKKIINKQGPEI